MASWLESLDVNAYVKSLMQKETNQINKATQGKLASLATNQTQLNAKISAYGQLQTALNSFQKSLDELTNAFKPSFQATSSNNNVATASVNGTVSPGNHQLTVTQIAQAEQVGSAVFSSNSSPLNMTNTLTIGVGNNDFTVNISSSDSLQDIAKNINNGAAANGVSAFASIISTSNGHYQLVISSSQTGADHAVQIAETGTGANALNISNGNNGTGTILSEGKNATFTLDNLQYNLESNTNSINGLNINLFSLGTSTLTINQNDTVSAVNQALKNTVDTYNAAMTNIAQAQASGTLPDSTLTLLQSTLSQAFSNSSILNNLGITAMPYNQIPPITGTTASGAPITFHPAGLLVIGTDPAGVSLSTKLSENFSLIQNELVGNEGVFTKVNNMLTVSTGTVWKMLNDPVTGALTSANNQLGKVNTQIKSIQQDAQTQKDGLLMKYAKLEVMLNDMQLKNQYLTQQLASLAGLSNKN